MISSAADLKKAILELELKRMQQEEGLRLQLSKTYQSLRPVNLIRNTLSRITGDSFNHNPLFNASVGVAAVLVTRKLLINKLSGPVFKRLAGGVIEMGVIKAAVTGAQLLKSTGFRILSSLLKKKNNPS
jgi:hypothetical protein